MRARRPAHRRAALRTDAPRYPPTDRAAHRWPRYALARRAPHRWPRSAPMAALHNGAAPGIPTYRARHQRAALHNGARRCASTRRPAPHRARRPTIQGARRPAILWWRSVDTRNPRDERPRRRCRQHCRMIVVPYPWLLAQAAALFGSACHAGLPRAWLYVALLFAASIGKGGCEAAAKSRVGW